MSYRLEIDTEKLDDVLGEISGTIGIPNITNRMIGDALDITRSAVTTWRQGHRGISMKSLYGLTMYLRQWNPEFKPTDILTHETLQVMDWLDGTMLDGEFLDVPQPVKDFHGIEPPYFIPPNELYGRHYDDDLEDELEEDEPAVEAV